MACLQFEGPWKLMLVVLGRYELIQNGSKMRPNWPPVFEWFRASLFIRYVSSLRKLLGSLFGVCLGGRGQNFCFFHTFWCLLPLGWNSGAVHYAFGRVFGRSRAFFFRLRSGVQLENTWARVPWNPPAHNSGRVHVFRIHELVGTFVRLATSGLVRVVTTSRRYTCQKVLDMLGGLHGEWQRLFANMRRCSKV